jgi:hypothetical protein
MCLIHLYSMLVRKGHIGEEIGLFASLQAFFATAFFARGKFPLPTFKGHFQAVYREASSRREISKRAIWRTNARTATDLNGLLNLNVNQFFKTKSLLSICREAGWDPARINDDQVSVTSALGIFRIGRTKQITDQVGKEC